MSDERFRVNDLVKYDYSEIGEYIDENHTDRPLRNDEVCDLLNEQEKIIKELKKRINGLKIKYTNRGIAITKAVEDLHRKEEVYLADFDICKRITEYEWEFNNE